MLMAEINLTSSNNSASSERDPFCGATEHKTCWKSFHALRRDRNGPSSGMKLVSTINTNRLYCANGCLNPALVALSKYGHCR